MLNECGANQGDFCQRVTGCPGHLKGTQDRTSSVGPVEEAQEATPCLLHSTLLWGHGLRRPLVFEVSSLSGQNLLLNPQAMPPFPRQACGLLA